MAGSPFKIKEIAKEKETLLPDKLPVTDKLPTKDKHEKEKAEADKGPKDTKDHKDQKEHKDKQEKEKHEKEKQEKEGKSEAKDHADKLKHEKEVKDHKSILKEISPKEAKDTSLEKLPDTKPVENEAGTPVPPPPEAATAGAQKVAEKFAEKPIFDKVQKEKDKFEKAEKFEKFEVKEFDKVIYDVKYFEVPVVGPVGPGPVEGQALQDRLSALENAVSQLVHFIPENLRPDLSKGALHQEPDTEKKEAGGTAGVEPGSEPAADAAKKEGDKKK
jgi:hypothetical protein